MHLLLMNKSPFTELSPDQQRDLMDRLHNGDEFIFEGEGYTVPGSLANEHMSLASGLFEVTPKELVNVAKHLAQVENTPGRAIEKAYSLICEAHVFSRNLKHWNDKSRRGHVSKELHDCVEPHVIKEGKDRGRVPRLAVLQSFLKSQNKPSNKTDTGKTFNRWVKETLREKSFDEVMPWNPSRSDYDQKLNTSLNDKGWIRWIYIGSNGHLVLPTESEKPVTQPRTKIKEGDHVTRPWWNTKKTWWPNPTSEEQKKFKAEFLCGKNKLFHSDYSAKRCLRSFSKWLAIQSKIDEEFGKPKKKQSIDPKTGQFS
ncbi:hypothetical protein N9027_01005 [bacterium]|nr:hypothetical protein [bacterium]